MYVYYRGKRYKVVRDEKGRPGIWITHGERKIFVTLEKLRSRVAVERFFRTTMSLIHHISGSFAVLTGTWAAINKLLHPESVALTMTVRLRGRSIRIPKLNILLGSVYATEQIAKRLLSRIPPEDFRSKRFLRDKLGDNFVGFAKKPPEEVLSRRVPSSHLRGLRCIEVRNPEVAIAQLMGRESTQLQLEHVSVVGGFYVPHARVLFFSRQYLKSPSGRLKWDARRVVTHEVGHHVYYLARRKNRLQSLLQEWNKLYKEAATRAWHKESRTPPPSYFTDPNEGFARYYAMMFAGDDQVTPRKRWTQLVGLETHRKLLSVFKQIIRVI